MTPKFRRCTSVDLCFLHCDKLYSFEHSAKRKPDIRLAFENLEKHPQKERVIATKTDDFIIGFCILVLFWTNEYRGDLLEIDEMFVAEKHRGRGVTTALFSWLEKEFAEEIIGFALQVSSTNTPALRMHREARIKTFKQSTFPAFIQLKFRVEQNEGFCSPIFWCGNRVQTLRFAHENIKVCFRNYSDEYPSLLMQNSQEHIFYGLRNRR